MDFQCGVFLAALAPLQNFCVVAPALTISSNPDISNGKCTPQCLASDHVLVPFLPFEDQGSGWSGAYYFIQPTSASSVPTGGRAIALSAGTLESGYGELKFQCLPLRSQCYALQISFAKEYLSADSIEFPQIFIPDANLQHQKDANEKGVIKKVSMHFHKNHLANLLNLCSKCHDQFHKTTTEHKKTKTSKGIMIQEI